MRIGIIGAGHAGFEAAKASRECGVEVTLFSAEAVLPYYRPRLVALAFGQVELQAIQMKPVAWYEQQSVKVGLSQPVTAVNPDSCQVSTAQGVDSFDGLVLTNGSVPVLPPFAAAGRGLVLPLWNVEHALAIRKRVSKGGRLVVVGGGILGIEAALHAVEAGMSVTLVELMQRLMPAQFGVRASVALLRRLEERGIRVLLGHGIAGARAEADTVALELNQGDVLEAELCLVSIGARPDKSLAAAAGLDCERGMVVDQFLRTRFDRCYAAGDVIQFAGVTRCSMKEAGVQGRLAALNLIAALRGGERKPYLPETIPLTFKSKDFEIYAIGETAAPGSEEHLLDGSTETLIRAVVMKDNIPVGVQMIGTREGFDSYAAEVKKAGRVR